MRPGHFLVMRYGPMTGYPPDSRRRISVVTRETSASAALYYAKGWLEVERQHGDRTTSLWIAKAGASATRSRR